MLSHLGWGWCFVMGVTGKKGARKRACEGGKRNGA